MLFSRLSVSLAVRVDSCKHYIDLHTHRSNLSRFWIPDHRPVPYESVANYPEHATGGILLHVQLLIGMGRVPKDSAQASRQCRGSQN